MHCHDVVTAPRYPAQLLLGAQSLCTDETHSQDQCVVRPSARRGTEHVYETTTALADAHGLDTLDTSDTLSQGGPDVPWCAVTSVTGSQPRVRAGLVVVAGEGVTAHPSRSRPWVVGLVVVSWSGAGGWVVAGGPLRGLALPERPLPPERPACPRPRSATFTHDG